MAASGCVSLLRAGRSLLTSSLQVIPKSCGECGGLDSVMAQQVRYRTWPCHIMVRDLKRRRMVKQLGPDRLRINSLRKNNILPKDLQELADRQIADMPLDSSIVRIHNRCVITSRPRGILSRWRLSRITWRELADYNLMSGVTRACWGNTGYPLRIKKRKVLW
ncbi:small ribosomal subunit protein uS14m-like [Branchiostoma lanceolatum]|uniref:small ribosomal subunit protein uS14m-like n=1 Tax=Branchiostoma lanceolatum TaxID=7740 RepID=UPI0034532D55